MNKNEAIEILKLIINSLKSTPNQFHFEVKVTGTKAQAIGGGTGLNVQVTGGGPDSTTIGYVSRASGQDIEIAHKSANQAERQQIQALVASIEDLISELESKNPSGTRVQQIMESLKNSWVPNVITSLIANLLSKISFGT